jgi:head-tail adaptor
MIRLGQYRAVVVFKEQRDVQSDTGGVTKEWVPVVKARAYKKRFSNVTDKDKVEAGKDFYGHFGAFIVKYDPRIKESQIMEYRGVEYKIILLDKNDDNTYTINVNKINE